MTGNDPTDLTPTPPPPRGKGPRKSADPAARKRIDLIEELVLAEKENEPAPPPEAPKKPPAKAKKPAEKPPAEDARPDLGGRRWTGAGPVPGGRFGDVCILLGLLTAGVVALALSTKAGAKVPAEYRPAGWWAAGVVGGASL